MGTWKDPRAGSNPIGEKINARMVNRIVIGVFFISAI
jgi:hypothetical protein